MYYYDPLYLIITAVGIALSLIATGLVKWQFARGSRVKVARGLSGREVAQAILDDAGITDVSIHEHQGFLSDHYNPMNKTLNLSPDVYRGTSAASVGVAAHEVGHAIQHARQYKPMWMRSILVPIANLGSMLGPFLIMIGIAMAAGEHAFGQKMAVIGVVIFAAATLFTLITVPVEFNASSRAKERLLALRIVQPGPENEAVRGVLLAAGLTYVAAAIVSIMQLIYFAMRAGLIGGRRD